MDVPLDVGRSEVLANAMVECVFCRICSATFEGNTRVVEFIKHVSQNLVVKSPDVIATCPCPLSLCARLVRCITGVLELDLTPLESMIRNGSLREPRQALTRLVTFNFGFYGSTSAESGDSPNLSDALSEGRNLPYPHAHCVEQTSMFLSLQVPPAHTHRPRL